jgi:flavin reductase (DIM6/NTAB) family NADH-FMN oxidoreductase RutF
VLITASSTGDAAYSRVDLDPGSVRRALGAMASGVVALCAEIDGVPVGMVASSFAAGISFDPPLVLFSAQKTSTTWPVLRRAHRIGVSILSRDQEALCMQMASRSRDRFAGVDLHHGIDGALLIDGAACLLSCTVVNEVPAGDHEVVLLEVRELAVDVDAEPLVYHRSSFRRLTAPHLYRRDAEALATADLVDDWFFPATRGLGGTVSE